MLFTYVASKEFEEPGRMRPGLLYLHIIKRRTGDDNRLIFQVFASQRPHPSDIEVGDVRYPEEFKDARDAEKFYHDAGTLNSDIFMAAYDERNDRASRRMRRV